METNTTEAKCRLCGKEIPAYKGIARFVGRTIYICDTCADNGTTQLSGRRHTFTSSPRGKDIIAQCERNR